MIMGFCPLSGEHRGGRVGEQGRRNVWQPRSELPQETHVVAIEIPNVGYAIATGRDPLDTQAERKA
jgi:hypothetical protein